MTVNRFCGSSMSAIHIAVGQIAIGAGDAFICDGVESMTRVPQGGFNSPRTLVSACGVDAELLTEAYIAMGETAEDVAAQYGITRRELDFASQQKAAAAQAEGRPRDDCGSAQVWWAPTAACARRRRWRGSPS